MNTLGWAAGQTLKHVVVMYCQISRDSCLRLKTRVEERPLVTGLTPY